MTVARKPKLLPLPKPPTFPRYSPEVVRVLDNIRFEAGADDQYAEFAWFAREYPRVYRYHLDNVQFRLTHIYAKYETRTAGSKPGSRTARTTASKCSRQQGNAAGLLGL